MMGLREATSGVVLAGGKARRMGGLDKGLVPFCGKPLIAYAIETLRPLCREIYINANRSHREYGTFGLPVIEDAIGGFAGPLAGVLAAMEVITTPYLLVVPCDAPALTAEILKRLLVTVVEGAEVAVASDGERLHPVVMALRRSLGDSLRGYLEEGGRKIDRWLEKHALRVVEFQGWKEAFFNLNTPETLVEFEKRWRDLRS